jgi:hypothetical protein
MMMSPKASRLVGDLGALVPDVNRHRLFTFDGRAPSSASSLTVSSGSGRCRARKGRI